MVILFKAVLWISVVASLMILLVTAVRRGISGKVSPAVLLVLWSIILVRLCFPFTFSSPVHLSDFTRTAVQESGQKMSSIREPSHLSPARKEGTRIAEGAGLASHGPDRKPAVPGIPSFEGKLSTGEDTKAAEKSPDPIRTAAAVFWITGGCLVLWGTIKKAARFRRRLLFCKPVEDDGILQMVEQQKRNLGVTRDIALLKCNDIPSPAVFGYWKPCILLPTVFLEKMSRERLNGILLHEICHIRRRDLLRNAAWLTARAVHWFNPLVWMAYRLYQEDVELCCDQMVIRNLEEDRRLLYGESLIEAVRFGQGDRQVPSVASPLYRKKSRLRERILRLTRPQKKSGASVCTAMLLAVVMTVMGFTTACQKTPDGPVVVGKGNSKLEKLIQTGSGKKKGRPGEFLVSRYKDSFPGADKKVSIDIDAKVTEPASAIPVVEVRPHALSMDQIRKMAHVLFHGNPAWEPRLVMTKAEVEEQVIALKKELSNEAALLEQYSGNQEAVEKQKAEDTKRIQEYEKMYPDVPEFTPLQKTDWTFHPITYYIMDPIDRKEYSEGDEEEEAEPEAFQAISDVEDYHAMLQVGKEESPEFIGHCVTFDMGSRMSNANFAAWNPADTKPMTMPRKEVISMVEDALVQMGISNMQLFDCRAQGNMMEDNEPVPDNEKDALILAASGKHSLSPEPKEGEDVYSYTLTFVPSYNGVPAYNMGRFDPYREEDPYIFTYGYEELMVRVDNGRITYLNWYSPVEVVKTENRNADTLSLRKAAAVFKKQMQLEYTIGKLSRYDPEDNDDYKEVVKSIQSGEIHITNIRLCLMRLRIRNRAQAYHMVPVWIFEGSEKLYAKHPEELAEKLAGGCDDVPGPGVDESINTYAIINAIDGSIVDGNKGY